MRQLKKLKLGRILRRNRVNRSFIADDVRSLKLNPESGKIHPKHAPGGKARVDEILAESVKQRSKGMPLQYIIGNQPFGNLDIRCRSKVLIPRPETEMYTDKVANLLLTALNTKCQETEPRWQRHKKFRILDLCTGTGCIALLLHSILKPVNGSCSISPPDLDIEILGVDDSPQAIELARENLVYNISQKLLHPDAVHTVSFQNLDVLDLAKKANDSEDAQELIRKPLNAAAAGVGDGGDRQIFTERFLGHGHRQPSIHQPQRLRARRKDRAKRARLRAEGSTCTRISWSFPIRGDFAS